MVASDDFAPQTETEKLRERIHQIVQKRITRDYDDFPTGFSDIGIEKEILQACKKAKLIWWNRGNLQRILYQCGLNAEQVVKVIQAINSQIKEIDTI